jgi:hypothetical protein
MTPETADLAEGTFIARKRPTRHNASCQRAERQPDLTHNRPSIGVGMSEPELNNAPLPPELRKLVHDLKNQLYVINMGLEVLRGARDNPEEITRLLTSIRADGLEPLKSSVARLIDVVSARNETDRSGSASV